MNKETFESLKNIIDFLKELNKTNSNPNSINRDIRQIEDWISEVAKDYTD